TTAVTAADGLAGLRLEGGKLGIAVRAEDGKGHGRSFAGAWDLWVIGCPMGIGGKAGGHQRGGGVQHPGAARPRGSSSCGVPQQTDSTTGPTRTTDKSAKHRTPALSPTPRTR